MARISLFLICMLLLVAPALGCSCLPTHFKTLIYQAEKAGTPVSSAVVVGIKKPKLPVEDTVYTLWVTKVYSGNATAENSIVKAGSPGDSCFLSLGLYKEYLLPLKKDGTYSSIGGCHFIGSAGHIRPEVTKFLDSRTLCYGKQCFCAGGQRPVFCANKCGKPPSCKDAAVCEMNYCAGCVPEWFTAEGLPAYKEIAFPGA